MNPTEFRWVQSLQEIFSLRLYSFQFESNRKSICLRAGVPTANLGMRKKIPRPFFSRHFYVGTTGFIQSLQSWGIDAFRAIVRSIWLALSFGILLAMFQFTRVAMSNLNEAFRGQDSSQRTKVSAVVSLQGFPTSLPTISARRLYSLTSTYPDCNRSVRRCKLAENVSVRIE